MLQANSHTHSVKSVTCFKMLHSVQMFREVRSSANTKRLKMTLSKIRRVNGRPENIFTINVWGVWWKPTADKQSVSEKNLPSSAPRSSQKAREVRQSSWLKRTQYFITLQIHFCLANSADTKFWDERIKFKRKILSVKTLLASWGPWCFKGMFSYCTTCLDSDTFKGGGESY